MEALRRKQCHAYRHPQRPLGIGGTISKIAASCVLETVQPADGAAASAHKFVVNNKGGCDMMQRILQAIMETEPGLARKCLDASNAFGDM